METLKMAKNMLLHPIDFFYDLQDAGRARVSRGFIMIGVVIVIRLLSLSISGFLFQPREAYMISPFTEALTILILWLSWSIANWGVSSMQEGEGKFKEILVGSAYALTPYIVLTIPLSLLTNLLSKSEKSVYLFFFFGMIVWVALLLLMQIKILHDYELPKLVLVTFLTIVGMLIIWFVIIMVYGLANQAVNFALGLIKEINYRI
ncbi:YIP1 family protein [Paenibacillus mendelii]|uniref:YIP1 family protein n=1 Tax=Paenibacillus mendelii TaxID=206163 RepID=A0ABV6JAR5_9BACL|nr:YIP1 family protein [Paenibacillus mendelii]MCQ6563116.1 YIP1 family protein [Paenibacillus mendelii]